MTVEGDVLDFLTRWQGGPAAKIEDLRGLGHPPYPRRDIEAAIETLRLEGHPIVAGNDGLRLTDDPAELAKYIEGRRRRMASIYLGSRALRKTARRMQERRDLTLFGAA